MIDYEPQNIMLWTMPSHYAGPVWPGYYRSGVGKSRESSALERANFDAMLRALGGESETVIVVRESHWAVGWVEWIAIHQDDGAALKIADKINEGLDSYPVIDDDLWSEYEWDDAEDTWINCYDKSDRIELLRERGDIHTTGTLEELLKAVRGDYGYACIWIPPSELVN